MAISTTALGCRKTAVPDGDVAATLAVPLADGAAFDPATLRGKPTLVLFASPTCHYCAEELPIAQRAAAAENANIVAVYISGGKDRAKAVAESLEFTGPVLVDDGGLRKQYGVTAVPYTLVLGADGHARDAFRGLQTEDTLRSALADAR